jgi:hypothetical protein
MKYKIVFLQPFTDGNVFPDTQKQFSEKVVTDLELALVKQSGGEIEILGQVIPPSNVKGKKGKRQEPAEQVVPEDE